MNDLVAALIVFAVLLAYALCLASVAEQQRAFEDELLADHER